MKIFKQMWNILTGADANADGKVDIKDAFIKAERKVEIDLKKAQAPKEEE